MAAISGTITSRPGTSAAGPFRNKNIQLPMIPHPMANMPDSNKLQVEGKSSSPVSRTARSYLTVPKAHTFVSLDPGGRLNLGQDRGNLPVLQDKPGFYSSRLPKQYVGSSLTWPETGTPIVLTDRGKYRRPIEDTPRYGTDELEIAIIEKLETGQYGLKHLFRSNDPSGHGAVTREGLGLIVSSLIGYVPPNELNKLLRSKGLDSKANVTFEDFMTAFKPTEKSTHAQWVMPVCPVVPADRMTPCRQTDSSLRLKPVSRDPSSVSAVFIHSQLKALAAAGRLRLAEMLPESSFEADGIVLAPHLTSLISNLGYTLPQHEFRKLWQKYDTEGAGALKTSRWCQQLGLEQDGSLPKPKMPPKTHTSTGNAQEGKNKKEENGIVANDKKHPVGDEAVAEEMPKARSAVKRRRTTAPKLDSVMDSLHYKFEEAYHQLAAGMQCFDFLQNGLITRMDFKRVLHEFGFLISTNDLEYFLSRISVRIFRGQLSYREFLLKFWNTTPSGMIHRIVNNKHHPFNKGVNVEVAEGEMKAEDVEAKLIEFIHGDFIKMVASFKEYDKYDLGLVTLYEFKNGVEKALGYSLSNNQWDDLRGVVTPDKDGLIPYNKFLDKFASSAPGLWNRKEVNGCVVAMAAPVTYTSAIGRLQDVAKEEAEARKAAEEARMKEMEEKARKRREERGERTVYEGLSIEQLNSIMYELVKERFHDVDRVFKSIDRRMTGRMSKHQFADLLTQCKIDLKKQELERLWDSFPLPPDGVFTLTALVRHYAEYEQNRGLPTSIDIPLIQDADYGLPKPTEPGEVDDTVDYHGYFTYAYGRVPTLTQAEIKRANNYRASNGTGYTFAKLISAQHKRLKSMCSNMDMAQTGFIKPEDMKDLLRLLRISIDSRQFESLTRDFTNGDRLQYALFLDSIAGKNVPTSANDQKISPAKLHPLLEICPKVLSKEKAIRRVIKKFDPTSSGVITTTIMQNVFKKCDITIDGEALFEILSKFDTKMDGKICYDKLLQHFKQLAHN